MCLIYIRHNTLTEAVEAVLQPFGLEREICFSRPRVWPIRYRMSNGFCPTIEKWQ